MATPGADMDTGEEKFCRMVLFIVKYAQKVLQNILCIELEEFYPNLFHRHCNNGLLDKVLEEFKDKLLVVLSNYQRKLLYPSGNPSASVTVGDLDLLLTVLLLRYITSLDAELTVWDDPPDTDKSTEAEIGRIKRFRNSCAHATEATISDKDFIAQFKELKTILLRLSSIYTCSFTSEDYDAILSKSLDAKLVKKCQGIHKEWRDYEKSVSEKMETGFEGINKDFESVLDGQKKIIEKLEVIEDKVTQAPDGQPEPQKRGLRQDPTTQGVTLFSHEGNSEKLTQASAADGQSEPKKRCLRQDPTTQGSDVLQDPHTYLPERMQDEKTADDSKLPATTPGTPYQAPAMSPTQSRKSPLAAFYTRYMSQIQRIPWISNDTMLIDDVYVNLEWVQEEKKPTGTSSKPVPTYTSIFENTRQGNTPKRILVRGKAGIGKTTFTQKMAIDWANATLGKKSDGVLSKYKHLLILNLRSIQPGETLKKAIEMQIPCSEDEVKEIMVALDIDSDHVLLVFDGYDEYDPKTSKEITDIIHRTRYQDVCTIITTRPWKAEELMNPRSTDSVYDITGLTNDNIAEYIAKFFGEKEIYDKYLELKSKYRNFNIMDTFWKIGKGLVGYLLEKKLMSLVKIPILLLFICLLWQEDQSSVAKTESFPVSYTLLYKKLIELIIRLKHKTRTEDETDKCSANLEETMNSLGKLAYYGLLKPEGGLIFDEKDLQSIPDIGEMYSLGLLNESTVQCNFYKKQAISFPHKTIQEYLAAKYLVGTLDKNVHVFYQFLESLHTTDELYNMDYVLRFLCGLSKKATVKVLERAKVLEVASEKRGFERGYGRYSKWCYDLLLEHWCADCTQATVLSPELISWHATLYIPSSFEHPDPGFQQCLCDTVLRVLKSPGKYSRMARGVVVVFTDVYFSLLPRLLVFGKTQHILLLVNVCGTFQELLTIICSVEDICVFNHLLSITCLDEDCQSHHIFYSIPNPRKYANLRITAINVNSEDILQFRQMISLKHIYVRSVVGDISQDLHSTLALMPTLPLMTDIELKGTFLGTEGVKCLAQILLHVPGLETLKLWNVLSIHRSRNDMISRCGASKCTCDGDNYTREDDRCQDVCEAVFELSQGVKHTTKLKSFSLNHNHLGRYHGITGSLIALVQSLSKVSEQTGMKIGMDDNNLGNVDCLSDLIEAIVNSYEHVNYWGLLDNCLEKCPRLLENTKNCEVSVRNAKQS